MEREQTVPDEAKKFKAKESSNIEGGKDSEVTREITAVDNIAGRITGEIGKITSELRPNPEKTNGIFERILQSTPASVRAVLFGIAMLAATEASAEDIPRGPAVVEKEMSPEKEKLLRMAGTEETRKLILGLCEMGCAEKALQRLSVWANREGVQIDKAKIEHSTETGELGTLVHVTLSDENTLSYNAMFDTRASEANIFMSALNSKPLWHIPRIQKMEVGYEMALNRDDTISEPSLAFLELVKRYASNKGLSGDITVLKSRGIGRDGIMEMCLYIQDKSKEIKFSFTEIGALSDDANETENVYIRHLVDDMRLISHQD